jgi:hypothetical protein
VVAGAVAATVASLGVHAVQTGGLARLRAYPHLARPALRLPWQILREAWVVLGALLRRIGGRPFRGRLRAEPFDAGPDDAEGEARRAAVAFFRSLAPNAYVVDLEDDHLLLHELVPREDGR